jgi:hypothetical protein
MKWRRRLPNNRARCCFRSRESVGNPGIDEFAGQLANARTTKDTVIVVKDRYRVSIPEKKDWLGEQLGHGISIRPKNRGPQTRLADGNNFVIENG